MKVWPFVCVTLVLAISGCQGARMPWQKSEPMPPVELLDDTSKTANGAGAQPAATATASGLALSSSQRFKDVPLPEKAKEDLDRSYIYESSSLQIGRMVYSIRADINEVARFYNDQCPAAGWRLENIQQATSNTYMLFLKPGKRLEVSIESQGVGRGLKLVLHMVPDGGNAEAIH